ncbi:MAG: hypothetical protein IJ240_02855 [Clostridia bacterium]|nr:hypothetical protein [Clostridia bacterium]
MDIKRIDSYVDSRFSKTVLNQHGAYLVDNEPYQIEITDSTSAVISGNDPAVYKALIEEFRFHAPHIFKFYDQSFRLVIEYSVPHLFDITLESIQPSQFYVDEEKLKAIQAFISNAEDIVIQVIPYRDRFVSLDGHTRLYWAMQNNFDRVKAIKSESDDWVWPFVHEAERRNILCPKDMILLPHEQYEIQWNQYCDEVFSCGSAN